MTDDARPARTVLFVLVGGLVMAALLGVAVVGTAAFLAFLLS